MIQLKANNSGIEIIRFLPGVIDSNDLQDFRFVDLDKYIRDRLECLFG